MTNLAFTSGIMSKLAFFDDVIFFWMTSNLLLREFRKDKLYPFDYWKCLGIDKEGLTLLNLLNELGKRETLRFAKHFIAFGNRFNKFTNTGAGMLDSNYHMTLKLLLITFLE